MMLIRNIAKNIKYFNMVRKLFISSPYVKQLINRNNRVNNCIYSLHTLVTIMSRH